MRTVVEDSWRKVFLGGLPCDWGDERVRALVRPFGALRSFHLVMDRATGKSRGYAFLEFESDASTEATASPASKPDWAAWAAALVHALVRSAPVQQARSSPAWREQCWVFAALAYAAVFANWVSTGDGLWKTLPDGYWPVAGLDLALLVSGTTAVMAARALRRRELGRSPAAQGVVKAAHGRLATSCIRRIAYSR